jgi:hypothetical protein
MDAIWKNRTDYNRNVVLHKVQDAFNTIIEDISIMQQILKSSQETPEPEIEMQYTSAQGPSVSNRAGYFPSTDERFTGVEQHGIAQHH